LEKNDLANSFIEMMFANFFRVEEDGNWEIEVAANKNQFIS
jgi:hypothetical protein